MKRNHLHLLILEVLMLLILGFCILISGSFNANNIYYLIFWVISTAILIIRFGFTKDRILYKIDILQITFIYGISYLMITYLLGILTGFTTNPYSMSFLGILRNVAPLLIIIGCQEIVRYTVVRKGSKTNIVLITMLLIVTTIMLNIRAYNLLDAFDVFESIGMLILPAIVNNVLLTYLARKSGYAPAILFRLIVELPIFLIPIRPDLGVYIYSVFNVLFPVFLFLRVNSFFGKSLTITPKKMRIFRNLASITAIFFALVIIGIVSGAFKVYSIAIASNSMQPAIARGDAVVVEKLSEKDILELEEGTVIVFEHEGIIVVHRLVSKNRVRNTYIFRTKGDNNEQVDDFELKVEQIHGIVRFKIPLIGYPSIWITENNNEE